ncbi:MAG: nitroreductase family protein [Nostocaceae cyanobacterium]|nr:nitroreductase family protein [Nostocaceae cyanobacterium]
MSKLQANRISRTNYHLGNFKFQAKQVLRIITPPEIRHKLHPLWVGLRMHPVMLMPNHISNYVYDLRRFLKWSSANYKINTQNQLRAIITKDYHRIEKGLALKNPRVGFGREVIQRLLSNLLKHQEKFGSDETIQIALNTLFAYYYFNLEQDLKDEQLYKTLIKLQEKIHTSESKTQQGGVFKITKGYILKSAEIPLQAFFESRYSIRNFASNDVEMNLIEQAVAMAQKTPSVCNRQSSKVYVFSSEEDKRKVLSYQNGNRGFGDQANKVLIVVSDLENFTTIGERNQCWIDGGMYAMSVVYALHSLGLGTCCLNWSVEPQVDMALKRATGIKDSESVIMMIAVGHLPDELKVAQSPRKKVHEVLIVK